MRRDRTMLEEVYFASSHALERVDETHAFTDAVSPVAAALLPAAVFADMVEHGGNAFVGARDHVGQPRILIEQSECCETKARVADARPIAFVSGCPPEIVVAAADPRDGFLE